MNADNSDIQRRSVFQIGDWHIVKHAIFENDGFSNYYAIHENCNMKFLNRYPFKYSCCLSCGDAVPNEIQALVTLYHWDTG